MQNAIVTIESSITAGLVPAQSLIVLTRKQSQQVAMISDYAKTGDILTLGLSHDRALSSMVLNQVEQRAITGAIDEYKSTGNPSKLARLVNGLIGTTPVPLMPVKKVELSFYRATVSAWCRENAKGEQRADKTVALYRARAAFLSPVFDAIDTVITVEPAKQLETQE